MSDRYLFIPVEKTTISDDKSPSARPVGTQYYRPTYYPNISVTEQDSYIITKATDRLDLIANDFYGDSTLWWILAMANNLEGDSIYPGDGIQLRIPANLSLVLAKYNRDNSTSL